MPTCETCRFVHINWRKGDKYMADDNYGYSAPIERDRPATSVQCRKNAPTKAVRENDCDGWPWVDGDDWCGDHRSKSDD